MSGILREDHTVHKLLVILEFMQRNAPAEDRIKEAKFLFYYQIVDSLRCEY